LCLLILFFTFGLPAKTLEIEKLDQKVKGAMLVLEYNYILDNCQLLCCDTEQKYQYYQPAGFDAPCKPNQTTLEGLSLPVKLDYANSTILDPESFQPTG